MVTGFQLGVEEWSTAVWIAVLAMFWAFRMCIPWRWRIEEVA